VNTFSNTSLANAPINGGLKEPHAKVRLKTTVVLNGISLRKKFFYKQILPVLSRHLQAEVVETKSMHDAVHLASKAVDKGCQLLLAAGGDGTIHQVLNGMLHNRENFVDLPSMGVIPIGGGNDFARALGLQADASFIDQQLTHLRFKKIDIGKVSFTIDDARPSRYFINVLDAGMGPQVVKAMQQGDRVFGSGLAYYTAIIKNFFTYRSMRVEASTPTWKWSGPIRTLALCNGNYYGHGLCIGPDAKVDDHTFHTFICGDVSVLEFIKYSGHLKAGKKIIHDKVFYNETESMSLSAESPCAIEADGEFLGWLPARVSLLPKHISFLC